MQYPDGVIRPVSGIEALNYVKSPDDAAKIIVYYNNGSYRYVSEREIQVEFMLRSQNLFGIEKEKRRAELLEGEGFDTDYGFDRFVTRPKPENPYRGIDDLGRIVIPSPIRKAFGIFNRMAQFRIATIGDDEISLKLVDKGVEIR